MRYHGSDPLPPSPVESDTDAGNSYEIRALGYQVLARTPSGAERVVVNFTTLREAEAFVTARQDVAAPHPVATLRKPLQSTPLYMIGRATTPYHVEVLRVHRGAKPYGWLVYARGEKRPVARSQLGYPSESDAWSAAARIVTKLERQGKGAAHGLERNATDREGIGQSLDSALATALTAQ